MSSSSFGMFPFIISFFLCTFSFFFPIFHLPLVISSLLPWQFLFASSQALKPAFLITFVTVSRSESPLLLCSLSRASLGPKFCTETTAQKHSPAVISSLSGWEILHNTKGTCGVSTAHPKKKRSISPCTAKLNGVLFPAFPQSCLQSQSCFWSCIRGTCYPPAGEGWQSPLGCPCPVLGVSLLLRRNLSCIYWSCRKTKKDWIFCKEKGFHSWRHHMEIKHRRDLSTTAWKEVVARLGSISSPS